MNGCAPGLVLIERLKATRKWAITSSFQSSRKRPPPVSDLPGFTILGGRLREVRLQFETIPWFICHVECECETATLLNDRSLTNQNDGLSNSLNLRTNQDFYVRLVDEKTKTIASPSRSVLYPFLSFYGLPRRLNKIKICNLQLPTVTFQ